MSAKIEIRRFPAQVITATYQMDRRKYEFAMPPFSIISKNDIQFVCLECYENVYLDLGIRSDVFGNLEFQNNILATPLKINRNFAIGSFESWRRLTANNPNFMLEQFDPHHKEQQPNLYANPSRNLWASLNGNLSALTRFYESKNFVSTKTFPPRTRSIKFKSKYLSIKLPEMTLAHCREAGLLFCLSRIRDQTYIPLYLPNVALTGVVCLGLYDEQLGSQFPSDSHFQYFWNSIFDNSINNYTTYSRVLSDQDRECPAFFLEKFDPTIAESRAQFFYNIDEQSRLSWDFGPAWDPN